MYNNQVRFGPTPTITPRTTINRQATPFVPPLNTQGTNIYSRPLPNLGPVGPVGVQQRPVATQTRTLYPGATSMAVGAPIRPLSPRSAAGQRSPRRRAGCGCGK